MSEQNSYDSIASAAAAMGTTVGRLRWAKKKGAPGFRGSRVYPAELGPWLEAQEEQHSAGGTPIDKEGWEIRKLKLQCEGLEVDIEEKRERFWDANAVRASWLSHMRQARQVLLQMATDLAPRIAGRPALECEQLLSAAAAEALGKLRGNPYGDVGECKCSCGRVFDLVGVVSTTPAAKGNEEERKAAVESAPHLGADVLAAKGNVDLGSAQPGKKRAGRKRSKKGSARATARKVEA
jgi:hypothetical protein